MFGSTHDVDNSFSHDCEKPTRTVEDLQVELTNALEEAEVERTLSLRPLVLQYEKDITAFITDLKVHTVNDGRAVILSYEADEMLNFLEKLLKGAHEIL